ncbi:hypothetical protein SAMN05444003_2059 [Cognatiyoonia sediminum]|uniref:Uncharacterized protein n=1 Tax=Cognatiyoonia sediminum TaxID=1508389 RepID=A0A1M5Q630_9RHOB|nr:hypothetical protein SAMN05444003_2059 [Cognatiyoonia sediminum]
MTLLVPFLLATGTGVAGSPHKGLYCDVIFFRG